MDSFEVPVNIAIDLDEISQMCHFLIVNTIQKSVDAAIEHQIVARLTDLINFKKMPVLPRWIQRQVDRGEDQRALAPVQFLNTSPDPPYFENYRSNPISRSFRALRVSDGPRDRSRSGMLCADECQRRYPLYRAGGMY